MDDPNVVMIRKLFSKIAESMAVDPRKSVLVQENPGTLIDPEVLSRGWGWLALIVGLVVVAKVLVAMSLARVAGLRGEPVQIGVGLGQIGEFSFVLGSTAAAAGAIGIEVYQAILGAVVVTIIGSTVLVRIVGRNPRQPPEPVPVPG